MGNFCLPGSGSEYGSIPDPDPKHWRRISSARVVQDPVTGRPVQSLEFLLLVKSSHSMKDFMQMTKKLLDDLNQVPVFKGTVQPDWICMRVVPYHWIGLKKDINRFMFFIFLFQC